MTDWKHGDHLMLGCVLGVIKGTNDTYNWCTVEWEGWSTPSAIPMSLLDLMGAKKVPTFQDGDIARFTENPAGLLIRRNGTWDETGSGSRWGDRRVREVMAAGRLELVQVTPR
jgi:hypothetical protein